MKNILIVDDDPGIRDMLKMLLEINAYKVYVSGKPEETEENILKNKIDLVLLDMLISGVNGTDICADIKKNEAIKEVKVVMISALHDIAEKSKAAGADGFVAKPFEIEDLLAKVKEVLGE